MLQVSDVTAMLLSENKLRFHESCCDIIREFSLYSWRDKAGEDVPVKENDHAMDDMRYFVAYALKERDEGSFFAFSVACMAVSECESSVYRCIAGSGAGHAVPCGIQAPGGKGVR